MNTLKKFKQFVDKINLENGRLYKESILEKYKDEEDIRFVLHFIFSPYTKSGLSDSKLNKLVYFTKPSDETIKGTFPTLKDILIYIQDHKTGRDIDIFTINKFKELILENNLELIDLFDKIITQNIQLGATTKTINKYFTNCIEEFNVQLANKYFDMKPDFLQGKEFAITTKIDGMRCIMLKENGNVTFWSRQGQPIEGLVDLEEEAKYLPNNICLDGELVVISENPDTYKQTMKLARTKDTEKHGLKMKVFDCMTVDEFKNQCANNAYHKRRDLLDCVFNGTWFIHDFKYFEELPILYQGRDTSKIIELLEEQTLKGEEGIMLNLVDAPYIFGRTNNLLKVKKFQTLDLEVIGFEEGTNSNQGTLGALLVRYKDGNIVKVGSGFEKELRDEIWNNQSDWLGAIIEVQYFEETENADGGKSIRFPVFKDRRIDKNTPDY